MNHAYPKELTCGFVVQPVLIDEALLEIEKRVKQGAPFLCLPTHYQTAEGKWTSCTDANCEQIFALANELGLPIQVHPYDYEKIIQLAEIDDFWLGHIMFMASLTAAFYHMYVNKRMHEKYPNVRIYLSHGNALGMATVGRAVQGFQGRPDYYPPNSKSPGYALQAKNIFCDSITHDRDVLQLLKRKIGITQIIHGIDSPYPLGDGVDYVNPKVYPGFTLDDAEGEGYITREEKRKIFCENVVTWLYGENNQKKSDFKKLVY